MLRLWPETLRIGIYAGRATLLGKTSSEAATVDCEDQADAWCHAVATLLDSLPTKGKGAELRVCVSDRASRIFALPWREALRSDDERIGYAHACMERAGINGSSDYAWHAAFLHYRGQGLAYGLEKHLLASLLELGAARGMRITNVMPVSAIAYAARSRLRRKGLNPTLLIDGWQLSLLCQDRTGLCGYDTEGLLGSLDAAVRRLIARASVDLGAVEEVAIWAPGREADSLREQLSSVLGETTLRLLPDRHWVDLQ